MGWRTQNLSYDKYPTWQEGRGWWGRFSAEWAVFRSNLGPRLSIGKCGFSIGLFKSYLFFSWVKDTWHAPEWGIRWNDGAIWISTPWERPMAWLASDPWYKKMLVLRVREWFTGRQKYSKEVLEQREVLIPLPEGCYRAVARHERATRKWRWYVPMHVHDDWWLEIPGGIPFAGKGENSWDCGDDGLFGCGGDTLPEAIGRAVSSVLEERKRHGHDSKGTGREPLKVVNQDKFVLEFSQLFAKLAPKDPPKEAVL